MTGPTPIIEKFNTAKDEAEYIIKSLKELTDQEQAKACIVVRRHIDIERFIAALVDAGISYYQIEQNAHDSSSQSGVRIATMHRVKGLEFDYVYIASVNEGVMPLNVVDSDDPTIIREHEQKERSLLYVAITRAKRFCSITSFGKPSLFIGVVTT
jgi:superfamily I DNA/RNA helicase